MQHRFHLVIFCGINLQQAGHILNFFRIAIYANHADNGTVDPQRHIAAFLGTCIAIQLIFVDTHQLTCRNRFLGTLMKGSYTFPFRGCDDNSIGIHNIDGATTQQRGSNIHQVFGQFFQQHAATSKINQRRHNRRNPGDNPESPLLRR